MRRDDPYAITGYQAIGLKVEPPSNSASVVVETDSYDVFRINLWAHIILREAQKVAVPANTVLVNIKQSLAPGGILSGLEEVHIVATMNLDPVIIEINLKQKAFLPGGPDAAQ
ncbi:hypothetical protein LQW54_007278 [Pestalotiopsis sp. IQ-011]